MPDTSKPLTLLYFAWLRERVGRAEEELPLPPACARWRSSWTTWRRASRACRRVRNRRTVRCAVNQDFAPVTTELACR